MSSVLTSSTVLESVSPYAATVKAPMATPGGVAVQFVLLPCPSLPADLNVKIPLSYSSLIVWEAESWPSHVPGDPIQKDMFTAIGL